jgi:hypothetical protein
MPTGVIAAQQVPGCFPWNYRIATGSCGWEMPKWTRPVWFLLYRLYYLSNLFIGIKDSADKVN